jgi:hypothetical protein
VGLKISSLQSKLSTNVTELQPAIAATPTSRASKDQYGSTFNIEAQSLQY